jgi:DNA-binding LacI/PurR family transcriptional regulator
VSAVLRGSTGNNSRYSPETAERVLAAAKRLRYRPNRTALNVLRQRHGIIGVPVDNLNSVPLNVLNFLFKAAKKLDYLEAFENLGASGTDLPVFVRQDCVDGLIVFEDVGKDLREAIRRSGQPCVYVNTPIPRGSGGVQYDEDEGVGQAVTHLQEQGYSRVAFLYHGEAFFNRARQKAAKRHCRALGLPRPVLADVGSRGAMLPAVTALLQKRSGLDGLLLSNSGMAATVYAAADRVERSIGRDLGVVGVGSAPAIHPGLTTVRVDTETLADLIMDELVRVIQGAKPRRIKVGFRLQKREST